MQPASGAVTARAVAPGRVNLIGEHTDYTGGFVLPMAIPFHTLAEVHAGGDAVRFTSSQFEGTREVRAGETPAPQRDWTDYPVGVLVELQRAGIAVPPGEVHLRGDVPLGAGLSSSASVEVATAVALLQHAGVSMSAPELALLCQRAENSFAGSPCGIMDQFAITASRAHHALLLRTRTLDFELLPLEQGELARYAFVVVNSMVKHSIGAGKYGARRAAAEEAQAAIAAAFPGSPDLGRATLQQLEAVAAGLSPDAVKRARHIVSENARVLAAADCMRAGDARGLGQLMLASHRSQRDDFECSTEEIDFLVDRAAGLRGCAGARLTGGGFGGCTVNLVESGHVTAFTQELKSLYRGAFGIDAQTYVCTAVDGALARLEEAAHD